MHYFRYEKETPISKISNDDFNICYKLCFRCVCIIYLILFSLNLNLFQMSN